MASARQPRPQLPRTASTRRPASWPVFLLALGIVPVAAGAAPAVAPAPLAAQVTGQTQPSDTLQELVLVDGSILIGRVVEAAGERIVFETTSGLRVELTRDRVRSLRPARGRVVGGEFWPEDPNQTRLLVVSPTGRTLPKGQGYLSAFWVVFPFVGYGVTDDFTVAAGTPIVPEVIGRVFYLAPKVRVLEREKLDVALGVLAFFATEELDEGSVGLLYGVGTFGDSDRSLTAGAGWAYAWGGDDPQVSNDPLIVVGGENRVGRRTKLVTENFFVPGESGAFLTGGVRFFGERLSVDFGIGVLAGLGDDDDDTPWLPLLNFVYNFGGDR